MAYAFARTKMVFDEWTLAAMRELALKESITKVEVMRRAIKHYQETATSGAYRTEPVDALGWLQKGGGLSMQEAHVFREEVKAEREAKRYWWEEA